MKNLIYKGRGAVEDQIKHLKDMLQNDFAPKLKEAIRSEISRLEGKLKGMKAYDDKGKCPKCGHKME